MNTSRSSFLRDAAKYKTVPVTRRFFVDTLTPIQLFQQLNQEAVFLLESRDDASPWSRYSFIGLNPYGYLTEENGNFRYEDRTTGIQLSGGDFQSTFQKAIDHLNVKPLETSVPFY
ncbi:MAG TPA: anthranilate synthase component I, partial [Bacillales bacterium]|nr:anthranilate synthase component I [Bacillales bacterium]